MSTIYFIPTPETLEDLKKLYRMLAMKHHPDVGGDTETMKAINNEYDCLFEIVKTVHRNKDGETYRKETTETPSQFKDVVNALIKLKMDGVEIELIGCFLWVSGNTKPYKDDIKALGFKWSTNKCSWYIAPDNYRKRSRKQYSMNDIRGMFGSAHVAADESGNSAAGTFAAIHA